MACEHGRIHTKVQRERFLELCDFEQNMLSLYSDTDTAHRRGTREGNFIFFLYNSQQLFGNIFKLFSIFQEFAN